MTDDDLDRACQKLHHSSMSHSDEFESNKLSKRQRWFGLAIGLLVFGGGTYGVFHLKSTVGATTLVIIGAGTLLIAAIGQWPDQFNIAGNGIGYLRPSQQTLTEKAIEDEIETAPTKDLPKLMKLQEVIASSGGEGNFFSYIDFDQQLQLAIRRIYPKAKLVSRARVGSVTVDFLLKVGSEKLIIETRYLKKSDSRFKGVSLDLVTFGIPKDSKLLVISNVEDVEIARKKVADFLTPESAEVISWRGPEDDAVLAQSIRNLIPGISK